MNKVVVTPRNNLSEPFFNVKNHPSGQLLWDRETLINELSKEVLRGNVTKIIDKSIRNHIFYNKFIDDKISQTYVFKNNKKYDALKIEGPKSFFNSEEIKTLSALPNVVSKLKFHKSIKKLTAAVALSTTFFVGAATIVNSDDLKNKFEDFSNNASVYLQANSRGVDLYEDILSELNIDYMNMIGINEEPVTPISNIDFESEDSKKAFLENVRELKEEKLQNSKVKEILDKVPYEEAMNKYYGLMYDGKNQFVTDEDIANYIVNNLSKEEQIVIHENNKAFESSIDDLVKEQGLNYKSKGNAR